MNITIFVCFIASAIAVGIVSFYAGAAHTTRQMKKQYLPQRILPETIELACLLCDGRSMETSRLVITTYAQRILKVLDPEQYKKMKLPEKIGIYMHDEKTGEIPKFVPGEILQFNRTSPQHAPTTSKEAFDKIGKALD
jgi:hypothetical protein